MVNEVFLSEDGHIEQVYAGDQTDEALLDAMSRVAALIVQLKQEHRPIRILVDISHLGRLSTAARKLSVKALKDTPYDHIAVYGSNTFTKALASLIIYAAGKRNTVRLFNTRAEAREWLAKRAK